MKLGDVITLARGTTYKSSLLSETEGPILLGLGSIDREGGFKFGSWKHYPGKSDKRILLHPGDLYASLKDLTQACCLLGAVARVPNEINEGRLTQDTVKLEFDPDADKRIKLYTYWSLRTPQYRSYCKAHATGTTNMSLSRSDFLAWELPAFSAQKDCLIQLFESIEQKRRLNDRLNDYLERCLLARYDHLFGNKSAYDGTIADIGDVVGGATPSKKKPEYYCRDGIGWITPRDLSNTNDKFIAHGADDITQAGFDSCSVKKLPTGSVLFSSRAPIGYIAIAADEVTTNQGFKSIIPHMEIGTAFVYCFLVRNKNRIVDAGSGTTFPEVSGKTMVSIELTIPNVNLCAKFEDWATPLFGQQRCLEQENRRLESLRDALLPKLMSGEIDVSKVALT